MSEYWVSKKKYYCKYCEIYIADDAPSRHHHEGGMRHKGNLERFIRGIYKTGEKRKKDQDEEKREMARVEQLANAAFAKDVDAGRAKAVAGPSSAARRPVDKPSNPYANYSTAESLGYVDIDSERLAKEQEIRRSQGVAGKWHFVTAVPPPLISEKDGNEAAEDTKPDLALVGDKRPAEADAPAMDEKDTRSFKLRKKTLGTGLGEIYDPGLIPIKVKLKKEEDTKVENESPKPSDSAPIKWTSLQMPGSTRKNSSDVVVKQEEGIASPPVVTSLKWTKVSWDEAVASPTVTPPVESDSQLEAKQEPEPDNAPPIPQVSAPLFKKRKTPASTARGRRPL